VRDEVIGVLSAQEIAVLLLSLPQGKDFFQELSLQLREVVKDEVGLLRTLPPMKLREMTKTLEKKLVFRIKSIKGSRSLQEICVAETAPPKARQSA
jgi:hypothetical protein